RGLSPVRPGLLLLAPGLLFGSWQPAFSIVSLSVQKGCVRLLPSVSRYPVPASILLENTTRTPKKVLAHFVEGCQLPP
ncbi:hypothetical protein LEMLEM_LOCUS26598, partial [Lemmus lemmus]